MPPEAFIVADIHFAATEPFAMPSARQPIAFAAPTAMACPSAGAAATAAAALLANEDQVLRLSSILVMSLL
jgi:hypothetical protein